MTDDIISIERISSREYTQDSRYEEVFIVKGTNDTTEAVQYGPERFSAGPDGTVLLSKTASVLETANPACELVCEYEKSDPPETTFSMDLQADTEHVEVAISQRHYPLATGGDDDSTKVGNLIGYTDNGVDGVDIYVPKQSIEVSFGMPNNPNSLDLWVGGVNTDLVNRIRNLVGTVNGESFLGAYPKSVLFLGGQLSKSGRESWNINLKYVHAKHKQWAAGELTSDVQVSVLKYGWEYLWYYYMKDDSEDSAGNKEFRRTLRSVHVAQVYEDGDFDVLEWLWNRAN